MFYNRFYFVVLKWRYRVGNKCNIFETEVCEKPNKTLTKP